MKTKTMTTLHLRKSVDCWPLRCGFLLLPVVLACFALLPPKALGVLPAPDGGYANDNTAEGTNALFSLTNGAANTATGSKALYANTTGNANTASGYGALLRNKTGANNIALGHYAGEVLTTGSNNIDIGNRGVIEES